MEEYFREQIEKEVTITMNTPTIRITYRGNVVRVGSDYVEIELSEQTKRFPFSKIQQF